MLFNWLYAAKLGGTLVLRVEDTDQARSTREHERTLLDDIERLGLAYAEGVFSGDRQVGPYGPYRQSERLAIYSEYARKLRDEGKAYYCFCSDEVLTQKRELAMKLGRPPHYDGTCAKLTREEAEARLARGEKAGLRFRTPSKSMVLRDHVKGEIEFKAGVVGDFFITRTPTDEEAKRPELAGVGMPVYNFCCVIDDALMKMTHVIRGEDHLSNTSRQLMIYDAFGWTPPEFAHTASVLGNDRTKLSKRSGDTSVFDYLDKGYLPEALLNFLVLLGWWPKQGSVSKSGHPEIYTRDELVQLFDLEGLQKAPAVFDPVKLRWMNAYYLRHMPIAEIAQRARPFFEKAGMLADGLFMEESPRWFEQVIAVVRSEAELLSDMPRLAAAFLSDSPRLEDEARAVLAAAEAQPVVQALTQELGNSQAITEAWVADLGKRITASTGLKGKALFMPLRAALTGKTHGPELKLILPLLGTHKVKEHFQSLLNQAGLS